MEPREVLALYDGYEWRRGREAGMLAFLGVRLVNALKATGGIDRSDMNSLIEEAERWLPEEPK